MLERPLFRHALIVVGTAASVSLAACGGGGSASSVVPATSAASAVGAPASSSAAQPTSTPRAGTTPAPAATGAPSVAPTSSPSAGSSSVQNQVPLVAPAAANAFVQSVGVNVHLGYWGTPYTSNPSAVAALITNLGVHHVRDMNYAGDPGACASEARLASSGVGVDAIATIGQNASDVATFVRCLGPALEAVEGPNEYDLTHPNSDTNWPATLASAQRSLYAAVKGVSSVPVLAPALTTDSAFAAIGSISDAANVGNFHPYMSGHNPGGDGYGGSFSFGTYGSLAYFIGIARQDVGSLPIWATEAGFGDAAGSLAPVSPTVKMHYTLRTVLEHWKAGIPRTYIYQLIDADNNEYASYGIVDANLSPKPAYTALKSLLAHVSDPSGASSLSPLGYALSAPSSVHQILLQRSDGSYELLLWNDVTEWDTSSLAPIATQPASVTMTFARTPASLRATTLDANGNPSTTSVAVSSTATATLNVDGAVAIVDIVP